MLEHRGTRGGGFRPQDIVSLALAPTTLGLGRESYNGEGQLSGRISGNPFLLRVKSDASDGPFGQENRLVQISYSA